MKLKSFEIENFRSIVAPTRCYVETDITVLAGKNESGKSNILHALRAFTTGEFEDTDFPEGLKVKPKIITYFTIVKTEIEQLAREVFDINDEDQLEHKISKKDYEVKFIRTSGEKIKVSGEAMDVLEKIRIDELEYWESSVASLVKEIRSAEVMTKNQEEMKALNKEDLPNWMKFLGEMLVTFGGTPSAEVIEGYKKRLEEHQELVNLFSKSFNFHDHLWNLVPKFVLFDSFEDILPSEADEDDVNEKDILKRFFVLAGIEPVEIFNEESSKKRKRIVNGISSQISGDFCGYYKQSEVELKLDVDGDKIQFYVYDGQADTPFFPAQRSKGFQWFLSFYLTLKSTGIDKNHVILIDEPGLYLHAKAQQEMLQILENLAHEHQTIFSTHSPYLIDTEHLNRVRLVMKDQHDGSTFIENKIQKVADKDTLAPIVTAIGYDLGQGLSVGHGLNILMEGISDYYYMTAFIKLLSPVSLEEINLIPAVGVDQIPNIASILFGWGVKCVALFDNDAQGRSNHTKIIKKLGFVDGLDAIFVSETRGSAIEDIFSSNDFHQFVLQQALPTGTRVDKNSNLAGERKVTLAKTFFESVRANPNITLSQETHENIRSLLEKIGLVEIEMATA